MTSSGGKTPVSLLVEYLVSNKEKVPQFEFTAERIGTHNPEFTCRVQVGAHCVEGVANSKQLAKHRAAEKMLKTLQSIPDENIEEKLAETDLEPVENYVGYLKELCINSRYPEPKYYLEEAAGPAHSRVFKMICCVSQLQDFGISKTKKQAKQQAACKMLERLKEIGCKLREETLPRIGTPEKKRISEKEVVEKYQALKQGSVTVNKDVVVFYKDHHKAYMSLPEESLTLTKILSEGFTVNVESSLLVMENIAEELEVKLSATEKPTHCVISMSVFPPIAAVGGDKKEAAFNLLHSLIILCT